MVADSDAVETGPAGEITLVASVVLDAVFLLVEVFTDYVLNKKDKTDSKSNDDRDTLSLIHI